jgi:hypothetical protein
VDSSGPGETLRPLGLGEVLDRAVTLCVKQFLPFAMVYLVYAVPLAVVSYFASQDLAHVLATVADAAKRQPGDPSAVLRALQPAQSLNGPTVLLFAVSFLVGPLAIAALTDAVAASYLGRAPTFASAYRVGLGRWLPMIVINVLYLAAGVVVYLVTIVALVLLMFGLFAISVALHGVGIAISVMVGIAATIAGIAFAIVVTLALQVSYFTCVVEGASAWRAFVVGLRRIFARVGIKRALLVGVAYLAIVVGIGIVSLIGQSVLVGLLRSTVAGTVYATLVRVATAAFTTAFVGIFYFDLRVREEGFDLELAAERVAGAVVPS